MKRVVIFVIFLLVIGLATGVGNDSVWTPQDQQEELIPSDDSVSVDDLDPIFYEAEEEDVTVGEKSDNSLKLIIGAVGVVILLGLGYLFISRSRSQKEE